MKRLAFALALAVTLGCLPKMLHVEPAPKTVSYVTKHGITVHCRSGREIAKDRIELITDIYFDAFEIPQAMLSGWTLYFTPDYIKMTMVQKGKPRSVYVKGLTQFDVKVMHVSDLYDCVAQSALLHELVHASTKIKHVDSDTSNVQFWQDIETITQGLAQRLCMAWYGPQWAATPDPPIKKR